MSAEMKNTVNWLMKLATMAMVGGTALYFSSMRGEVATVREKQENDHAVVIEMRTDLKYIKESIDDLKRSVPRPQWPPAATDRSN